MNIEKKMGEHILNIYYLWDERRRIEKNKRGENDWFCYITEMLTRLGVAGCAISAEELEDAALGAGDALFAGAGEPPLSAAPALREALARGMTLVGFETAGIDDLFGIKKAERIAQPDGEYGLTGYFKIREDAQSEYLPVPESAPPLPVFAPVGIYETAGAEIIADIITAERSFPVFFKHSNAYYFAFDLAQTLWVGAQGKPVAEKAPGFSVGRLPMARVTPLDYNTEIAYGDYYLYILQNILAGLGYAMLHRLPPAAGGKIPDLVLYYAGDEDACDPSISADAAAAMAKRGLPYHINLMPFGENMDFRLSPGQFDKLRENGCELDMHYNMTENYEWCAFAEKNFRRQYRSYLRHFGVPSVSVVGHCLAHEGWAERMRYLEGIGIRGDFGRTAEYDPADINAFNQYGFAFGTSFPSFAYDGAMHGNRKIELVEAPIAYYEPRIGEKYPNGADKIHRCIDSAAYFGRMINLFTHPHYLTDLSGYDSSMTKAALDEALGYIKEKGLHAVHSAPDKICNFWHGRGKSKITNCLRREDSVSCRVECCAEEGLVVRFPEKKERAGESVAVDGQPVEPVYKTVDGIRWLMVPVMGIGGHIISISKKGG